MFIRKITAQRDLQLHSGHGIRQKLRYAMKIIWSFTQNNRLLTTRLGNPTHTSTSRNLSTGNLKAVKSFLSMVDGVFSLQIGKWSIDRLLTICDDLDSTTYCSSKNAYLTLEIKLGQQALNTPFV